MGSGKMVYTMTLMNSIIGCGIILAILLLIISNFITRTCCYYLLKSSAICRRRSMEVIAFSIFASSGKLMVELCVIGYLLGSCITYFVVVGDLGPQIFCKIFNLDQTNTLRSYVMIFVTIVCIIPLGLLRNVDSLAAVCTASIGFYFCLVLKIMGESSERISMGDWVDKVDYWNLSGVLQCLPIFSMALSCQMQLFEVFENVSNISLDKMMDYVKSATTMCTFVYILVGFFGYVAFCTKSFSGNILLNLSPSLASDIIKIGFVLSVACSVPLIIFPCRASLYSLLYRRGHADVAHYIPEHRFKLITISLVSLSLFIGILIPSIEFIIGFVGSTIGVAICIMFPASCFIKVCQKKSNEKLLAQFLLIFGFKEQEIAIEKKEQNVDDSQSELKRLEETEKLLQEMKSVLEKQNQETQQLVLQKFDEIVDKVEKIEKVQEEDNKKHDEEIAEKISLLSEKKVADESVVETIPLEKSNAAVDKTANNQPVVVTNQTVNGGIISMLINKQANRAEPSLNNSQEAKVESKVKLAEVSKEEEKVEHVPIQRDLLNVNSKEETADRSATNFEDEKIPQIDLFRHKRAASDENCNDGSKALLSENEKIFPDVKLGVDIDGVKVMGSGRDLKSVQDK